MARDAEQVRYYSITQLVRYSINSICIISAAFGVSAFVKGLGIPVLKAIDLVPRLRESITNGEVNARQGALFALECLSEVRSIEFRTSLIFDLNFI
jgi:hypothetical protein